MAMNMGSIGNVGGMATMMGIGGGMEGMMEMALAAGANATKVLVLENMLSVEELATDEYAEVLMSLCWTEGHADC